MVGCDSGGPVWSSKFGFSRQTEPSFSRVLNTNGIQRGVDIDPALVVPVSCFDDQGQKTLSCRLIMIWSSEGSLLSG